jgi:hypothetical protein
MLIGRSIIVEQDLDSLHELDNRQDTPAAALRPDVCITFGQTAPRRAKPETLT